MPSGASGQAGASLLRLFLGGDVMTGRGIDQVLPRPGDPRLFEPNVRTARDYVALAEAKNGPIPQPADYAYVWGDALGVLDGVAPDARIVNLETSVTTSSERWRGKPIHYRMHPDNVACLRAARIDCCALANNHVLDWGVAGLHETVKTLRGAGIATAGAGRELEEATAPAILTGGPSGRVLVFGLGTESSGIPRAWAAAAGRPGVHLLPDLSVETVRRLARQVERVKGKSDVVVASIHWGGNWGYAVSHEEREFAHGLIEEAGVDVIHGHSSHHPKGMEVHRGRLILYGCGDFLNDYEGISGYEDFRSDLVLMYLPTIDRADGRLARFHLVPLQIRRFRLHRASRADAEWVRCTLNRTSEPYGTRVDRGPDDTLTVRWG